MRKFLMLLLLAAAFASGQSAENTYDTPDVEQSVAYSVEYEDEDLRREAFVPTVVVYTEERDGFCDYINYLDRMKQACLEGDVESGRAAECARNAKIETLGLEAEQVSFDDLFELSKIITAECGSSWLPFDWKLAVGEVVLNRVASPEFPDTIYDVVHAQGQYSSANTQYFKDLLPFPDCVDAAANLLMGERILHDPSVVFQSSKKQGSGVYLELYDSYYGSTYLCHSNYPELYGGD